jgi:Flp pilus assembly protein TadG
MIRRRRRGERGVASIWALAVTAGAFTVLLGLVVDGGSVIEARVAAAHAAEQAARLAADQLSAGSVRNGGDAVNPAAAGDSARQYLRAAGMTGTVRVEGDTVTVTVHGRTDTKVLGVLGITSFPVDEAATAEGVTEEDKR